MAFGTALMLFLSPFIFTAILGQTETSDLEESAKYSSWNKDLLDELFNKRDYNNLVRPVLDSSQTVNVTFAMVLTDITAMEEMEHQVEINAWARQGWKDEFLVWNPEDFGGKTFVVIPADLLWLPDITLYNSVGKETETRFSDDPGKLIVYYDGTVAWSKKSILRFDCDMRLKTFPFDEQTCYLRFGSWSYDGSLLNPILPPENSFDIVSEYHKNGEWALNDAKASLKVPTYNVTSNGDVVNGSEPEVFVQTWPEMYFTLYLSRKFNFYLLTLMIPYFLISSLSGLVFVLQPDSGEKMGLAITTLLSLVVFNEFVMQIVPPSADYLPLLADYFVIMIVWVGFSVVVSAWVLNKYHQEPKDCTWMGPISRAIIFGFMASVVCDPQAQPDRNLSQGNLSVEAGDGTSSEESTLDNDHDGIDQEKTKISDKHGRTSVALQSEVHRIRRFLEKGKKETDVDATMKEVEEAPLLEWREAVRVVDKFFFWVYLIVNVFLMLVFTLMSIFPVPE